MAVRIAEKTDSVTRCVPTQDGSWLVVSRKGASGSSPTEFRIGENVVIRNGIALRAGQ